ncbi:MAG: WbqC family protein [Pseudomonadota bacterium]
MKKVAIIQPAYIPWKGYFHIIHDVDIFVFLDDVQYVKRSWVTRNKIKTANQTIWLSVPVQKVKSFATTIMDVKIDTDAKWKKKHLQSIERNYAKAPYYSKYCDRIIELLFEKPYETIADLDIEATMMLSSLLNIKDTDFLKSSILNCGGTKSDKILNICKHLKADKYITGPLGLNYLEIDVFKKHGISIEVQNYKYREYPQLHGKFDHYVSVIDMLFNLGPHEAGKYIWG